MNTHAHPYTRTHVCTHRHAYTHVLTTSVCLKPPVEKNELAHVHPHMHTHTQHTLFHRVRGACHEHRPFWCSTHTCHRSKWGTSSYAAVFSCPTGGACRCPECECCGLLVISVQSHFFVVVLFSCPTGGACGRTECEC